MRELFLVLIFRKEVLNSIVYNRVLKKVIDIRPFLWILLQQRLQQMSYVLAIMGWQILVITLHYFYRNITQTLSGKWNLECAHFVQQYSEWPNVRFKTVGLRSYYFRRKIIWRANNCFRLRQRRIQHSRHTKVSNLDISWLRHENIGRFQISMQNFPVVHMF